MVEVEPESLQSAFRYLDRGHAVALQEPGKLSGG